MMPTDHNICAQCGNPEVEVVYENFQGKLLCCKCAECCEPPPPPPEKKPWWRHLVWMPEWPW